jgi:hypothetical protein
LIFPAPNRLRSELTYIALKAPNISPTLVVRSLANITVEIINLCLFSAA